MHKSVSYKNCSLTLGGGGGGLGALLNEEKRKGRQFYIILSLPIPHVANNIDTL